MKSMKLLWNRDKSMMQKMNICKTLVDRPLEKQPFEKPRSGWKNKIKIHLSEVCCESVRWVELAQDRVQW
jgi:hypothetical protein